MSEYNTRSRRAARRSPGGGDDSEIRRSRPNGDMQNADREYRYRQTEAAADRSAQESFDQEYRSMDESEERAMRSTSNSAYRQAPARRRASSYDMYDLKDSYDAADSYADSESYDAEEHDTRPERYVPNRRRQGSRTTTGYRTGAGSNDIRPNEIGSNGGYTGNGGNGRNGNGRNEAATSGGGNGEDNRKGGGGTLIGILIAVVVILAAAAACYFVLFANGKKTAEPESTEAETQTLADDAFTHHAIIDLSDALPEGVSFDGATGQSGQSGQSADEASESGGKAAGHSTEAEANEQNSGSTSGTGKTGESGDGAAENGSVNASLTSGAKLDVYGMTPAQIEELIAQKYQWSMKVTNDAAQTGTVVRPTVDASETTEAATMGDAENPDSASDSETDAALEDINVETSIAVPDFLSKQVKAVLRQMEEDETAGSADGKVYTVSLDNLDDDIAAVTDLAANMWYVAPKGGGIGSYDAATDTFKMDGSKDGYEVDKSALLASIQDAVSSKEFDKQIPVAGKTLSAKAQDGLGDYKIIGTYTTKTTANSVRNKNIQLAAEKLNGTILQPGEEFSFNGTVGERTAAKGYGAAAAYNEGEVVQEIGGGICQVSTTLYNAVLRSGLKTTKRQSHTFVPSYVTPGFDATVSWGGPDYRFANVAANPEYSNSTSYAIGIKAHYSNRTVTVSIYGRPVLKDGYTYELSSRKVKDVPVVRKLIQEGSGRTPTRGTTGSQWITNLVVKKNGEVVSDKLDHNTYYAGHIEYYTEQPETTAAPTETPTATAAAEETTAAQTTEAQPVEGPHGGPGVTASPQQTSAAPGGSSEPAQTSAAPGSSDNSGGGPGGSDSSGPVVSEGPGAVVQAP